jgi:hypothetical protein
MNISWHNNRLEKTLNLVKYESSFSYTPSFRILNELLFEACISALSSTSNIQPAKAIFTEEHRHKHAGKFIHNTAVEFFSYRVGCSVEQGISAER